MIRFGKDIDLTLTGKHLSRRYYQELAKQNDRARGLWRRLRVEDKPGVLLADEVGKGKTYVALAVAFAFLQSKKESHVLILTHSNNMAKIWRARWLDLRKCVLKQWDNLWDNREWEGNLYNSIEELTEDVNNGDLPRITFASYETLKKYSSEKKDIAEILFAALKRAKTLIKRRFSQIEKRSLVKDIVACDLRKRCRGELKGFKDIDALRILKCIDPEERWWKDDAYPEVEDILDHLQARSQFISNTRFDLLIVDEAHKLEGMARHRVVTRLLRKRFNKTILVTATPFAISVRQFRRRLLDFRYAYGVSSFFEKDIKNLPLNDFCKAVEKREEYPKKTKLEKQLRQYMVREIWNHARERTTKHWESDTSVKTILPTLLLERLIENVLQSGQRTHIASRRESLCSSWPAARKSMKESPLKGVDQGWGLAFEAVVTGKAADLDPKLQKAADEIVKLIQQDVKVVVFTQRVETSKALKEIIEAHEKVKTNVKILEGYYNRLRRHDDKIARWLNLPIDYAKGIVKVMAHSSDRPSIEIKSVTQWWKRHMKQLGNGNAEEWQVNLKYIIGRGRRLPLVVRHDADTGTGEYNIDKFNLPSSPIVLIATPKAQEGIDLHNYCRHIILFDLTWNPAILEQRIGRVHRLGGIRRANEKVVVIYCFQKGTYQEVMKTRVQQRCEMMRVLLGAGQWLDKDREIAELDKYKMEFPP